MPTSVIPTRLVLASAALLTAAWPIVQRVAAQAPAAPPPIIGRWDLVIDAPGRHHAGFLEVRKSGRSTLVGEFVGVVGSARPISRIEWTNGDFRFVIPPQWDDAEGDNTVAGRLSGDSLRGTISYANGGSVTWRGARAPSLRRTSAPVWGEPIALLDGGNLAAWKPVGDAPSKWALVDGILTNRESGADLVTDRKFTDFKLHAEFRYPAGSNSGVYLRGRYELQIVDTPAGSTAIDDLGSVYGHIAPSQWAGKGAGEWQTYDVTLVGRTVTVVLNGKTIICEREIPGVTGGALDSDEGAPGPIFLQGDHGPVEYRNIVITPAK